MSKLSIENLKYIALEGGGASGVVYNGAISALENKLKKKYNSVAGSEGALMDYLDVGTPNTLGDYKTKIKGVAGSSAGAINAFAITLGLSSEQIEKDIMQKVDFSIFLTEYDPGLYRMVGEDGELKFGKGRKPLGRKSGKYKFGKKVRSTMALVGDGWFLGKELSGGLRILLLNVITRTIASGILVTIEDIFRLFGRRGNSSSNPNQSASILGESEIGNDPSVRGILNVLRIALGGDNSGINRSNSASGNPNSNFEDRSKGRFNILTSMLSTHLLLWLLRTWKLNPKKINMKINLRSISNLIWDRGLFSGFTVREFFMDTVILAATHNTHFHRKLVAYKDDKSFANDKSVLLKFGEKFKFFYRKDNMKLSADEKYILNNKLIPFIEKMTFKQFYDITGITFGVCVSNFSTDQPLYFSHEYTPDFIVIEAVAASMTIPPAIKPLYNEMDVIKTLSKKITITVKNFNQEALNSTLDKITPNFNSGKRNFTDDEGNFKNSDYYELQAVVKKYLQSIALSKNQYIDLNNSIGSNSFLQLLREEVFKGFNYVEKDEISVKDGNNEYIFHKDLLVFFYNAAYKGLLIDGGYRNNIPYNFFREQGFNNLNTDLDKAKPNFLSEVLALKLDNSFPVESKAIIYKEFERIRKVHGKSLFKLLMQLIKESFETNVPIDILINNKIAMGEVDSNFYLIYGERLKDDSKALMKVIYDVVPISKYTRNKEAGITNKTIGACLVKIAEMFAEHYLLENEHKPWSVNKGILSTAMEGYEFGTGDGQIRYMSDHNFIIPLYTYGVSTFDFDFKKELMPLVKLSQEKSKVAIETYFP